MKAADFNHQLEDLISMYARACHWLQEIGFDYSINRYGIYEKVFARFISMNNGEGVEDDLHNFKKQFDNAYLEVNEIVRVHNNLKRIEKKQFYEQIKTVCSGQEFRGVSSNDQARDFLFELSIASRFIKAGFDVSLIGVCDVVVQVNDDVTLFVECKRIKSEKKSTETYLKLLSNLLKECLD